MSDDAETQKH